MLSTHTCCSALTPAAQNSHLLLSTHTCCLELTPAQYSHLLFFFFFKINLCISRMWVYCRCFQTNQKTAWGDHYLPLFYTHRCLPLMPAQNSQFTLTCCFVLMPVQHSQVPSPHTCSKLTAVLSPAVLYSLLLRDQTFVELTPVIKD